MSEWWTYTLSDFLLFSPRVYDRLLAAHNAWVWPTHVVATALGLMAVLAMLVPVRRSSRTLAVVLGLVWIWIAWSFFWERYATINWAAPYIAPAFALQGIVLFLAGLTREGLLDATPIAAQRRIIGASILLATLVGYPLLAPLFRRPWQSAELFAILPDPTAAATLAILIAARPPLRAWLMLIPASWCVIAALTSWTLGRADFAAPLAAMFAAFLTMAILRRSG